MKTALSIAGSDSSGGAGIQADIKTMIANGVYAMSAITALTAQNTTGVQGILEVTPEFLARQIDSVFTDIHPDAVKIGMVSSVELIKTIAQKLRQYQAVNIVVDPVMVATSGSRLLSEDAVDALKQNLLPLATVLTPNIPEAEVLSGMKVQSAEDMLAAARYISETYHCAVLCKGGHQLNDANDLLYRDGDYQWFNGKRINNPNTHGTGCTLSSAIASNLAKGHDLDAAVERAKAYVSGALEAMLDLGSGSGPMNHAFNLNGKPTKVMNMKTTQRLLHVSKEIWAGYHKHPFVRGIASGTLDREKFQYYMLQDYLYLIDYAKVFAMGAAKAQDKETVRLFGSYMSQILEGEMDLHKGYMKRLGISLEESEQTAMALDNLFYTSYMLRVAYEEGPGEIAAAILSCALSYEVIAKAMIQSDPASADHPFYGQWVRSYADSGYSDANQKLIDLIERLTADYSETKMQRLEEIFIACSRCESAFWDMAWEMRR